MDWERDILEGQFVRREEFVRFRDQTDHRLDQIDSNYQKINERLLRLLGGIAVGIPVATFALIKFFS